MIKAGIAGCQGLSASELIRILINHPDVELKWVADATHSGVRLDRIIPGIVGECELTVSGECDLADVDLVLLCDTRDKVATWLRTHDVPPGVKLIDVSGCHNQDADAGGPWVYGMSEMQRRVLVHEAQWVTVPGPAAVASLLAVMPVARSHKLDTPLSLLLTAGDRVLQAAGLAVDKPIPQAWVDEQEQELRHALSQCQPGFSQPVSLTMATSAEHRLITVTARFKSDMDQDSLKSLYQQYYEDHNFVFLMDRPIVAADVENTNKCLLRLSRHDENGEITVLGVMDGLLKAGVGNAVHAMNLMFGLYERIGLTLKASGC